MEDINMNVPYEEGKIFEIETEDVKKSKSFQNLVVLGAFEIVEYGDSRIEKNLFYLQSKEKLKTQDTEEEEIMESGSNPEVVITGHFYEAGGYAKTNRNLAYALASRGVAVETDVTTVRKSDLNEMDARQLAAFKRKLGRNAIRIDSIIPSFSRISPRITYRILYTTIEATTVPDQTVDICNQYDEIWVTSDFCKEVLEEAGVKRDILVMPNPMQTRLYNENHEPHEFRPVMKGFVFCSLFGWAYRKGYDALIRSYLQEFSGDDDVTLLIVSRYQHSSSRSDVIKQEIDRLIERYGGDNPAHIARCSRVIPEYQLPKVYKACNAFVLPSRGEGFGLPYAEAALCGLPVIATNHSGHTMFLKDDNSYLVDIDRLEPVRNGASHVHYWDGQLMPALRSDKFISDLGSQMRYVYSNQELAKEKNANLQDLLMKEYSFDVTADKVSDRIKTIWNEIGSK